MLPLAIDPAATPDLTLAGDVLVSVWKPLPIIAAVAVWAWVVAKVFDKDAARFYLPRETYNAVHLTVGAVAVAAAFLLPLPIFINLPIMIAILVIHLAVYVQIRNKHERVPDHLAWSLNPASWAGSIADARPAKKAKRAKGITMTFAGPNGTLNPPPKESAEYETRVTLEELFTEMIEKRGDKLEIVPVKDGATYGVATTVDGVQTALRQLPKQEADALMTMLKSAAGLGIEERRKKLRGELRFGLGDNASTNAWIVTSGTSKGMRLTALVEPAKQVNLKVDDLGVQPNQMEHLRDIVGDERGVVLLTAPPGNGRTALLYAMVRAHDAYTQNIQILELETQFSIEGVRHNVFEIGESDAEFATTARSILRRDPDVCGIAEMPDNETAQTVARADLEQSRVYLSLPLAEPIQATQAYLKAVSDNALAADGLRGVIGCRLLRKLCQNCRISYKPTPEMLKKLGLPADGVKSLYRTEGKVMVKDRPETCPVCGGTGFIGQVAAFAIHPINDEERSALREGDFQTVRGSWRQRKQPSIQSSALQLVVKGETTVDELLRVMQGKSSQSKSSQQKKAADQQPAGSQ